MAPIWRYAAFLSSRQWGALLRLREDQHRPEGTFRGRKMPVLQGEHVAAAGSPVKKSKLSLKYHQKKETKRVLDFSEPQADEPKAVEQVEPEARWVICVVWSKVRTPLLRRSWVRLSAALCPKHARESFKHIHPNILIVNKSFNPVTPIVVKLQRYI